MRRREFTTLIPIYRITQYEWSLNVSQEKFVKILKGELNKLNKFSLIEHYESISRKHSLRMFPSGLMEWLDGYCMAGIPDLLAIFFTTGNVLLLKH